MDAQEAYALRYTPMRCMTMKCIPMRYTLVRCAHMRYTPAGCTPTLSDIIFMATKYRNIAPESHLIGTVVAPLLHLVRRLSLFQKDGDKEQPLLEVLDMYGL